MNKLLMAIALVLSAGGAAGAASVLNADAEPRTILVTEGGAQSEIVVGPGETVQFCNQGCFVTMPNGDREALTGAENIEIAGGRARFR